MGATGAPDPGPTTPRRSTGPTAAAGLAGAPGGGLRCAATSGRTSRPRDAHRLAGPDCPHATPPQQHPSILVTLKTRACSAMVHAFTGFTKALVSTAVSTQRWHKY